MASSLQGGPSAHLSAALMQVQTFLIHSSIHSSSLSLLHQGRPPSISTKSPQATAHLVLLLSGLPLGGLGIDSAGLSESSGTEKLK